MNKIMMRVLIGLFIVLCLPASFFMRPSGVQASVKKASITNLTTIPENPKGDNGWFTSVTLIELENKEAETTYFQWNCVNGDWKIYQSRIRAWQGENTLYYYSINKGIAEPVKSKVIKVDYQKPVVKSLAATSNNGQVKLSWATEDAKQFKIYKKVDGNYRSIAKTNQNSLIDKNVTPGSEYFYAVKAIDDAGLQSQKSLTSVVASAIIVPIEEKKTVKPRIAGGSNLPATKLATVEPVKENETQVNESTPLVLKEEKPVKNWNRLLVAISILVITTGAAIGGYYGYEWWISRAQEENKPKKKNSRW